MKERTIKTNTDYKHFKGNMYHVKGVSSPTYMIDCIRTKHKYCKIQHTETKQEIQIYRVKSEKHGTYIYCHDYEEAREELVIYYNKKDIIFTYGRPKTMFLSEVDKTKYPKNKQTYRFEERINPII